MPVKWVPVTPGQGPLQRRERAVVRLHENLLQSQIVFHIPGEKHRMIDHHEILCVAPLLVRHHHVSCHLQHLDRHSTTIRNCIGLGLAGRVRKPNHCRVDAIVLKQPLREFFGQVGQHPEFPFGVALSFDMYVRANWPLFAWLRTESTPMRRSPAGYHPPHPAGSFQCHPHTVGAGWRWSS